MRTWWLIIGSNSFGQVLVNTLIEVVDIVGGMPGL